MWPRLLAHAHEVELVLPPATVLKVVRSAAAVRVTPRSSTVRATVPAPSFYSQLIPARVHIPDGYALDFDRDAPRFAEPIDEDEYVSLDLLDQQQRGVGAAFTYAGEGRPIGHSSDLLRIAVEYRF